MKALMKYQPLAALTILAVAAFSSGADAAEPATRGRSLALIACTYCHIVEDNQEVKPVLQIKIPTFTEIANDPNTTAQSLRVFLRTQHTEKATALKMPNPALNDDQIEDLVAYIMSRRTLHRTHAIAPKKPTGNPE